MSTDFKVTARCREQLIFIVFGESDKLFIRKVALYFVYFAGKKIAVNIVVARINAMVVQVYVVYAAQKLNRGGKIIVVGRGL